MHAVLRHGGQCNGEDDIDMEGGIQEDCFDTEGSGGEDGSEVTIIHCTFALIKMTSEMHIYVMKKQAGISGRKSTSRKGSSPIKLQLSTTLRGEQ